MFFAIFKHNKYSLNDLAVTVFGIVYIPFLIAFLILVRSKPGSDGFWLMWLVFIGAWGTDIFAYTFGRLFGKHKIIPVISPNKTVEGSVGGFLGCAGMTVLYGAILHGNGILTDVRIVDFVLIGICCGILSQLGDWMASSMKRYLKIKDFGNLMPGHGGALDRFDSILVIAPFVYFYASFILLK
jgi:phosphatidate cytidylyltransferase